MNPWIHVPDKPPFVLEEDSAKIKLFNKGHQPYSPLWINTGRLPEPRLGPINAPVVLLQLNASYDKTKNEVELTHNEIARGKEQLVDELSPHPCLAQPNKWWDMSFNQLLKIYSRERLSQCVCSVEFFPYPSLKYGHDDLQLSSHHYQTDLIKSFIKQGSILIVTRGLDKWLERVPELRPLVGKKLFCSKNQRRVWITPGNLGDEVFEHICSAL